MTIKKLTQTTNLTFEEFRKLLVENPKIKTHTIDCASFQLWIDSIELNSYIFPAGKTCQVVELMIKELIRMYDERVIEDFKQFYKNNEDTL